MLEAGTGYSLNQRSDDVDGDVLITQNSNV
jgi:hypothetical protein